MPVPSLPKVGPHLPRNACAKSHLRSTSATP